MEQFFANYVREFDAQKMTQTIQKVSQQAQEQVKDVELLKKIFNLIDITSLNSDDSSVSIKKFCEKVNHFQGQYTDMPNVAAICTYPVFASVLKATLICDDVKRAVVTGGFPSSQTFTDIKVAETKKAMDFKMDEVDMVISIGEFLDENYEFILEEVRMIKDALTEKAHLKVILETGLLKDVDKIWKASLLAMEGGADFIKTSTGKVAVNATPEAAYVMLNAIKSFEKENGTKVGFKVAGGVSSSESALFYYNLVKEILGDDWLNNNLFRIGASSLANNILSDLQTIETGQKSAVVYF